MAPDPVPAPVIASDLQIEEIRSRLVRWGHRNWQSFPWRSKNVPQWRALVTEFLLVRTRATQVVPVFHLIQREFPTAAAFGAAADARLARGSGYWEWDLALTFKGTPTRYMGKDNS
jgi:adenine-specific DNA glycosylase